MKKKIALLLFGLSYKENYKHHSGKKVLINYEESLKNYEKMIFKYYKNLGYEIDTFLATNFNKNINNLLKKYKPKSNYIRHQEINNNIISRNKYFLTTMKLCKEYAEKNKIKYEFVIMTRFDLLFKIPFNEVKINYNTMNIVSILEHPALICDNFYLFPFSYLDIFLQYVKSRIRTCAHLYKRNLERRFGNINYLMNQYTFIQKIKFYKIIRTYI